MESRITLLTLGVADLPRSISFYRDGLGFRLSGASTQEVAFFHAGGVVLALFPRHLLAEDAGLEDEPGGGGFRGITLAHNVREREQVDAALAQAEGAGATVTKPAQDAAWGGRSGYFRDPDGHLWEVAWNPGLPLGPDGTMTLPD
uniref:Lactoylglutathione lyase n=1 Tax=uncultured Armatimonadetes bacterium TaxID=157466 RepID=A0A6J4HMN0_9BACT|nr:Lactoylglutathione lyase [uncultured Armatimonadetes bacterium]